MNFGGRCGRCDLVAARSFGSRYKNLAAAFADLVTAFLVVAFLFGDRRSGDRRLLGDRLLIW